METTETASDAAGVTTGSVNACRAGLRITFDYAPDLVDAVRSIPGRKWHPRRKEWTCLLLSLPEAIDVLSPLGFHVPDSLLLQREKVVAQQEAIEAKRQAKEDRLGDAEQAYSHVSEETAFVPAGDQRLRVVIVHWTLLHELILRCDCCGEGQRVATSRTRNL